MNNMLIGIDGNEANIEKRVGVGEYSYQVLTHLYKAQSDKVRFVVYLKDKPRGDLPKEVSRWRYKVFGPKKFWTQIALPVRLFLEKEKCDIFFTPSHYSPRFSPCPTVISIMDLSFIFFPQMFRKKDLFTLINWTGYSVKKADKILTISNYSKKAIIEYYNISEDKIAVTYPGYDREMFRIKSQVFGSGLNSGRSGIRAIRNKYNIDGDYILFVGTLQPRKNIIRLIEAFDIITKKINNKTLKLVIVGKKGWMFRQIFEKVKEFKLEKKVIFTSYVPKEELPFFYKGAKCLVNPSLYEGFGLPAVEAMACGCPVVAGKISSLPEVAGEAGFLVDPYRIEEIAEGMLKILYLDNFAYQTLVEKGLKQVKKFNWVKCSRQTLNILKEVTK